MIFSPSTIGVLEEDSAARVAIVQALRSLGHSVIEADSEAEFYERLDSNVDLVILGGGYATSARNPADATPGERLHSQRTAVLRVFSSAGDGLEAEPERNGEACLVHPVSPRVLLSTVSVLLRAHKAEAQAEQARRNEEQFLGSLGHELRTPLNAIVGWSDVLIRMPRDADFMQGLRAIERNARLQAQLIDDLLDMARINSGRMRLEPELIDPCSVLESALIVASAAAQLKEISLERVGDAGADGRYRVQADLIRLQQVFGNLLSNAIKFSPKGSLVEVSISSSDSEISFVFSDKGCGIESERLPNIFERFRQSDSKGRRAASGLGLGLAIARHLVEMQGGKISALSEGPGKGACFTVALPLVP